MTEKDVVRKVMKIRGWSQPTEFYISFVGKQIQAILSF